MTVARQGIFMGIVASPGLMVLAGFGLIPPTVGALLQEVLDLATVLNALRAGQAVARDPAKPVKRTFPER